MKQLKIIFIKSRWSLLLVILGGIIINFSLSNFSLKKTEETRRIVSLNGTTSEILCALGLEKNIVGVDVTSTYPESLDKLPKVGHNRNISSEGVLALSPTLIVGIEKDIKPEVLEQFKSTKTKISLFKQEYTIEGTKKLINEIAAAFNLQSKAKEINKNIDTDLASIKKPKVKRKVLFIYARGAGTMMVAGRGTSVEKMIDLAGGQNAATGFNDFKPLTAEALVSANPDVILMFESGLKSMGGVDGLLKVPGVAETNAGKNKKVIEMDGQYLTGFGPRVGKAVSDLAKKLDY